MSKWTKIFDLSDEEISNIQMAVKEETEDILKDLIVHHSADDTDVRDIINEIANTMKNVKDMYRDEKQAVAMLELGIELAGVLVTLAQGQEGDTPKEIEGLYL